MKLYIAGISDSTAGAQAQTLSPHTCRGVIMNFKAEAPTSDEMGFPTLKAVYM